MVTKPKESIRIVSIAFNSRFVAYTVIEGPMLLDWGTFDIDADCEQTIDERVSARATWYEPTMVIIEDVNGIRRRSERSRSISKKLTDSFRAKEIPVLFATAKDAKKKLRRLGHEVTHKSDIARVLIEYFPQLARFAPPARQSWMGEDYRMAIFVALGLALHALDSQT